jgi:hypothetical protein
LKVGDEKGGEGGVSGTLGSGRLDVSALEDAVCMVVVYESKAPRFDFCVQAGHLRGVELWHVDSEEEVWGA